MKIEIESTQLRRLWLKIMELEADRNAYQVFYDYVVDSRLFPAAHLSEQLRQAKMIARDEAVSKFSAILQTLADISDQASADLALAQLAAWLPKGRPN